MAYEGPHGHRASFEHRTIREKVRSFPCTECGAQPHQKCIGVRGKPRSASHVDRWDLYREHRDAKFQ